MLGPRAALGPCVPAAFIPVGFLAGTREALFSGTFAPVSALPASSKGIETRAAPEETERLCVLPAGSFQQPGRPGVSLQAREGEM